MDALWADGGAELRTLLARARATGAAVSLDMTLPDAGSPAGKADWKGILARVLPLVDIFVPSIEELLFMMEPDHYRRLADESGGGDMIKDVSSGTVDRLADQVLALGVKVILIKAGHRGGYLRTGDLAPLAAPVSPLGLSETRGCPDGVWVPPFKVDSGRFRNACGAGDCAIAGFLSALLNGESVREAGTYAILAGRDNLYGVDAVSGLREWGQMVQEVKKNGESR
jgi:sugar/nucleoside kinase (ribokinase family)